MAQIDATSLNAALKEWYTPEAVRDTVYENNPFFGMLRKQKFGGKHYDFPMQFGHPQSRSADIATALASKKVDKYSEYNVTFVKDYCVISIDRSVMKQTEGDKAAFFEAQTRAIDSQLKSLVRSFCMALYRNKGGAIGVVGSVSTTTVTLSDVEEIANFEVDMEIVSSENDGSGTTDVLQAGSATITAVDRDAGTITSDANWTAQIAALDAGDFLFVDGDFGIKLSGLSGWCPSTAPSSGDSFFGVDRSVDVTRHSGCRVSAIGDPVSEAILKGATRLGREGAMPDTVLMSHASMRSLIIELGSKVQYTNIKGTGATVGFKGVEFQTSTGRVECYADHSCPSKKLYIINKKNCKIIHLSDDVPEIQDEDGSILRREVSSDGYEVRGSYYAQFVCEPPNENCVVTLAS